MNDTRPMWMKLATLRDTSCISAHYTALIIRFMRDWLIEIDEASRCEGYHLTMINVAIEQLEDELRDALEAIASGSWLPEPPAEYHEPEDL